MNKILKFVGVGLFCTLVDYAVYSLLVMVLFSGDTGRVGVAAVASGVVATVVAYFLHSRITWKTRSPGKLGVIKFFLWNAFVVILVRPILTWGFGLLTGLYEFAQMILPFFSFEFVESTGIYALMTVVTMILNFLFYEKIVFESSEHEDVLEKEGRKKIEMEGVRQARKEQECKGKTEHKAKK